MNSTEYKNMEKSKYPILEYIEIPEEIHNTWQEIVDLISEIFHVPAALIMRVHTKDIEVFAGNRNVSHPYRQGDREQLNMGHYCEDVMINRRPLLVPNAHKDTLWNHNPDIKLGMISYLGMPLTWPKGEIFGTICILDMKENRYSVNLIELLEKFSHLIMSDLHNIWSTIELEKKNEELRTLNKHMNHFLGILAHDLRGTMNILLGYSSLIFPKREALPERERKYLDFFQKSGITIANLLDELLMFTKIETIGITLNLADINLSNVIEENVQFNQPLAEAKGIQINLLAPAEPIMIRGDLGKIEQVLNNLISNAIKYSPQYSTITVSINPNPDEVMITVSDQGPGIVKEEQEKLFKPFQTTRIQPAKGEVSTGLGLYIAKRIVEGHGGLIWIESDMDAGSKFCFTLKYNPRVSHKTTIEKQTDIY